MKEAKELRIENLETGYPGGTALRIERAVIPAGTIATVLGPNGSGKSTLLRALIGLLPYRGTIRLAGKELRTLSPNARAREAAYLPQTLSAPEMTVRTLVSHGRFCRMGFSKTLTAKDRAQVEQALETAEMSPLADKMVSRISGGERQRAYLAMLLAQDADFILLDEPGSAMDISHRLWLAGLLRRLAESGKGILMTSHDLPQSFSVSDTVFLLRDGRMTAHGSPRALAEDATVHGPLYRTMGAALYLSKRREAWYSYEIGRAAPSSPCPPSPSGTQALR